jgi:hypothetical protein
MESKKFLSNRLITDILKAIRLGNQYLVVVHVHEAEKEGILEDCLGDYTLIIEAITVKNSTILELLLKKLTHLSHSNSHEKTYEKLLRFLLRQHRTDALAFIFQHLNKQYEPDFLKSLLKEKNPEQISFSSLWITFESGNENTLIIVIEELKKCDLLNDQKSIIKFWDFSFLINTMQTKNEKNIEFIKFFMKELDDLGILIELFEKKDTNNMTLFMYAALTGNQKIIDVMSNKLESLGILNQQLEEQDTNGKSVAEYLLDVCSQSEEQEHEAEEQQKKNRRKKEKSCCTIF